MIKISSIGNFFEEHVEKIILLIVGLVCAWLLITRVILSPNTVPYDDQNRSPSDIDDYVYEQAQLLRQKLKSPPEEPDPYESKVDEFLALLDSSINSVDTTLWPAVPYEPKAEKAVAGVYNLPSIGDVNDVAVGHIRAAAYVPINEVTPENPYSKGGNEPNDIDLVTVQARFDIAKTFENFRECFVDYVEEEFADPCLAKPIFAAVNLQRQELSSDGTWSNWRDVPRAKIDQYRKLFRIVEDTQDLPAGGLKVQMLQFENKQVQIDLLQPEAYQMASPKEEWFPPELYSKFKDLQRKETLEEKRQAKEAESDRDLGERRSRRADTRMGARGGLGPSMPGGIGGDSGLTSTRSRSRSSRDRQATTSGVGGGYVPEGGGGLPGGSRRRPSRNRPGAGATDPMMGMMDFYPPGEGLAADQRGAPRRAPSTNDVYYEFDEIVLDRLTDFSKLREPITFWHLDDTAEPKKTYRYRIRLGVFNPLAGTNQISERDISQKNKVILWSDFSDVTEPVEIPGRSYFFARDIKEAARTITITVSRYVLGHWYSEDFEVSSGETIGNVVENEIEEEKPQRSRGMGYLADQYEYTARTRTEQKTNIPESIDYSTGAVMVDAMSMNDWWGDSARRSRRYYDMLYSFDGNNIEHMPVGTTYWSKEMQTVFNRIAKLEREPNEEFKDFGSSNRGAMRPGQGEFEDMGLIDDMMQQQIMMQEMGGLAQ